MARDAYRVRLENVFEGPMDLLIHLIRKHEVDIYDIPIALITDQYLAYLEWMKAMNVDYAGEFLVMAATLTQIKSRLLLPTDDDEEQEDPREELTRPLLEYLQIKSAAERLAARNLLGQTTFVRRTDRADYFEGQEPEQVNVGLFELIDAFRKLMADMGPDQGVDITADTISVKDRITQIVDLLEEQQSLAFEELFGEQPQRGDLVVTFLAILEMVKLGLLRITQHVHTGVIRVFYQ